MSTQSRPIPTRVDVCDLCDQVIPDDPPDERGSLTWGYIAHRVTAKTKHAWLSWPPGGRSTGRNVSRPREPYRHYDFHAECILRLVEEAIAARKDHLAMCDATTDCRADEHMLCCQSPTRRPSEAADD